MIVNNTEDAFADYIGSTDQFPDELRALVRRSGLSQRAFAESIGVPLRTLEAWLAGDRTPNSYTKESILNRASKIFCNQQNH